MFIGIAIYGVIEEVGSYAAIIEQGVALPWRTVGGYGFAALFRLNEKTKQSSLCLFYFFREC